MIRKGYVWVLGGLLMACEKTIQLQPDTTSPKLVAEGQIENGQAPILVLSNSLNYFSTINAAKLNGTYVHNAKVSISNGQKTVTLKEYAVALSGGYFFYYYSPSQSGPSTTLFGETGKRYELKIQTGGEVYHATTTIPPLAKKIDSLWWKPAPNNTDSTKAIVMARIKDPPGYGDYIRYFTSVNGNNFYPGLNSVFDDQIIDGKTYDIQIEQGVTRTEKIKLDDYGYFKRGDTVVVKFCNIDKASYDFWRTWEFSYQSVGNPFSTPGKVLSNISNGGLGAFCGYSVQYKRLIIPK